MPISEAFDAACGASDPSSRTQDYLARNHRKYDAALAVRNYPVCEILVREAIAFHTRECHPACDGAIALRMQHTALLAVMDRPEAALRARDLAMLSHRVHGPLADTTLRARGIAADIQWMSGRLVEHERELRGLLADIARSDTPDHPLRLTLRRSQIFSLAERGHHDQALRAADAELAALDPDDPDDEARLPDAQKARVVALYAAGRYTEAETEIDELRLRHGRRYRPAGKLYLNALHAKIALKVGRATEAATESLQTAEAFSTLPGYGPWHWEVLAAGHTHAAALLALERYTPAVENARQLVTACRQRHGDSHPYTATGRALLASIAVATGSYRAAETEAAAAIDVLNRAYGVDHPETLTAWYTYAQALTGLGLDTKASETHQSVLTARHRILGPRHPDTAISRVAAAASSLALEGAGG